MGTRQQQPKDKHKNFLSRTNNVKHQVSSTPTDSPGSQLQLQNRVWSVSPTLLKPPGVEGKESVRLKPACSSLVP